MTDQADPTRRIAHPGEQEGERRLRLVGATARREPAAALVVGYRPDPASRQALVVAVDLARRLDAHLHVVHVVDLSDYPIDPDAADWEDRAAETLRSEQEQVSRMLSDQTAGWTYHAAHGDPVSLLETVASEQCALMVVVGTRGETMSAHLHRLLAGSVSHGLIRGRRYPVLVVPGHDEH